MKLLVRPRAVLYACQGCPEFGQRARDFGAELDRNGRGELVWLGNVRPDAKPVQRFPIHALDGCAKGCARRWLEQHGVTPQRHFVVTG